MLYSAIEANLLFCGCAMPAIDLTQQPTDIRRLAAIHGIIRVRMFGSRARGRGNAASDLDLLVDLAPDRDLLHLIAFKLHVEDLLGCRVDVLTEAALSPYLRDVVLAKAKSL
jgi:predicted nucleotidyltransferase